MRALWIQDRKVMFRTDLAGGDPVGDESRVRVLRAGICATDLALRRGYMGFEGIPGHEFVGLAVDGPLAGKRVVGEINAACGDCEACHTGLRRHCRDRTVLGILGRPGAFADELRLPTRNLHSVPDSVSDDAAVFVEPLAAAFEITEQLDLGSGGRALVAGDGKLGLLCAWVLSDAGLEVTVAGHHPERREILPPGTGWAPGLLEQDHPWFAPEAPSDRWDLAVEATGRPEVLARLIPCVRPRGTLVLKTTAEAPALLDTSPIVVNELQVIGSRCGPFRPALEALGRGRVPVEQLIAARYPLEQGPRAFEHAARSGMLKVLLDVV